MSVSNLKVSETSDMFVDLLQTEDSIPEGMEEEVSEDCLKKMFSIFLPEVEAKEEKIYKGIQEKNAEPITLACDIGTKGNRYNPLTTPAFVKPSNLGGKRKRPTELGPPAAEERLEEINTIPETLVDSEDVN